MADSSEPSIGGRWSLRQLVLGWGVGAALALTALHVASGLRTVEAGAWEHAQAHAATELARLSVISERLALSDRSVVTELLVHATLQEHVTLALLVDPAHRVRGSSSARSQDHALAEVHPEWVALVQQTAQSDATVSLSDPTRGLLATARGIAWPAMPGELRSQRRGAVLIVTDVGQALAEHRTANLRNHGRELAVLLLAGTLLLLALDLLVRRPLSRLREVAVAIGEGHFDQRAPTSNIRELEELGQTLGRMSADLQATVERLTDSEQRYRDLARSAPDAILTAHADGRIDEFNQAAERLFGYTAAEVAGRPLDLLLPERLASAHAHHLAAFAQAQDPAARRMFAGRQVAGRHRSGRLLQLEIGISRSKVGGQISFTAMIRDVSDRVRIEAELEAYRKRLESQVQQSALDLVQERDRAQVATRAKSEFLANMGHELRTPLNAIIGLTHLAARQAGPAGSGHLEQIERAAQGLLEVINDVLDFSRLEAGHIALVEAESSVWSILHAVCDPVAGTAAAQGVQVLEWVDPAVPRRVFVDELRLRQVLGHLVGNAVKFTSTGHVLVQVRPGPGGGLLRFEVSDTGIGMTPEVLARLFEPFEQGDSSDARRFGGAGIGLVISQRLLRLMGATLRARSRAGAGSTFWFDLALRTPAPPPPLVGRAPALDRAAPVAAAPTSVTDADEPEGPPPLRVLVVDHSDVAAGATRTVLEALGHQVQATPDAGSALQALQAAHDAGQPFDLCLIDAGAQGSQGGQGRELGDCEGFDIGRRLLDAAVPPPPCLLTALRNAPIALSTVLRHGFAGVLHKPLEPLTLARRLAAWRIPLRPSAGLGVASGSTPHEGSEASVADRVDRVAEGGRVQVEDPVRSLPTPGVPRAEIARPVDPATPPDRQPWSEVAGLDAGLALRSLRHDPAAYAGQVQRFVALHRHDAERLGQLGQRDRLDESAALTHALRASSAAIGAHRVSGLADQLAAALQTTALESQALGTGPTSEALALIAAHSAHLAQELSSLIEALDTALGEAASDRPPGWSPAAPSAIRAPRRGDRPEDRGTTASADTGLDEGADEGADHPAADQPADRRMLQRLAQMLARRDMSALRLVREHPDQIQALWGPAAPALLAAIHNFDFDGALSLLQAGQAGQENETSMSPNHPGAAPAPLQNGSGPAEQDIDAHDRR